MSGSILPVKKGFDLSTLTYILKEPSPHILLLGMDILNKNKDFLKKSSPTLLMKV